MKPNKLYDVIIIGGSYSGLSAALALGRSLREVVLIDSNLPCNRHSSHAHNFLTQDGIPPEEISATARKQLLEYDTVQFCTDYALTARKTDRGFEVHTKSGKIFLGKKLIFASGIIELMPEIKGFAECWGISMIHCPYCHGYEYKGKKTGIYANGKRAVHLASLVRNLTDDLTILTTGVSDFEPGQLKKFKKHNVRIIETELEEVEHQDGLMSAVRFRDGTTEKFDAIYAVIPFTQQSDMPASLGCEITEQGYIKIDEYQKATVEGVLACGDNSSPMRSLASAVSTGNLVGAMVNKILTDEEF